MPVSSSCNCSYGEKSWKIFPFWTCFPHYYSLSPLLKIYFFFQHLIEFDDCVQPISNSKDVDAELSSSLVWIQIFSLNIIIVYWHEWKLNYKRASRERAENDETELLLPHQHIIQTIAPKHHQFEELFLAHESVRCLREKSIRTREKTSHEASPLSVREEEIIDNEINVDSIFIILMVIKLNQNIPSF